MHKNATKCNKTQSKWCINKHGASKIIDTFETYQELARKIILSLPSCFILGVVASLNLEKLDLVPPGELDGFLQDTNRSLTIGQVMIEINRAMVDVIEHFGLVGDLETSPELGYMEDIVKIRQLTG
jgi:hypothetical protein